MRGWTLPISAQTAPANAMPAEEAVVDVAVLYRAHAAKVARWAARLGGPGTDVEDVVQEVFLVANRRLTTFDGDAKVTTWLFRATQRIVLATRRKQRLRRWLLRTPEGARAGLGAAGPTPSEALERQEDIEGVYRALDRMPERLRSILILFELEGLGTQEIATLTGVKVGTVRVRLFRARAKFLEAHQAGGSGDDGCGEE